MKYCYAKKKIHSGDVIAFKGKSWFSKVIKWWTKSDFTHVGIAWRVGDRLFVIEAGDFHGIRIMPASLQKPFYCIYTGVCWTDQLEKIILSHVGDPYSISGCIMAAFNLATTRDRSWQCAEFVNYILKNADIDLGKNCETPAKIVYKLLEQNYKIEEVI
jgi:hypothetical protein